LVAETLMGVARGLIYPMTEPLAPTNPFVVLRDSAPADALRGAVVAIGNFDGVHRGHRAVIAAALARAKMAGRPAAAMTFEPHPAAILRPQQPMFRLTDASGKLRLLAATGLDGAVVLTFDAALASLSPEEFVQRILVKRYDIAGATVGFDFHFGKNRMGSPAFLQGEGARHGFTVDVLPPLQDEGRPVSSGTIRTALAAGRVIEAAELLGYPWFASATVIAGDRRGRELGYPTANMRLDPACGLKHGIYAVRVGVGGRLHDAVASFGRRPMFDNGAPLLEVFLFDFDGDLYGQSLDVAFIAWIRQERQFDSIEALVRQMDEDSALAREALARAPAAFPALGDI
jgi:riboflavin kinase/FMN adenylyltransferase